MIFFGGGHTQGTGNFFSWQKDREISPQHLPIKCFLYSVEEQMIKHIIVSGIKDTEMISFTRVFNRALPQGLGEFEIGDEKQKLWFAFVILGICKYF
ncbi:hypothetical protein HUE58_03200 [Candidatus Ruthia endofausta]|uniref:Uncharacterized protein n=1 Tax=Candidatus Ruthia endofausta TaxID=2738852 RepID=A0A6N0HPA8_9GAMM|nr:hypothetical protein [Candidatus Ruthia endofausta]QKQ24164.1 hypothetical protein HUE58_03200 [Candidatus Ruthia endofausta]